MCHRISKISPTSKPVVIEIPSHLITCPIKKWKGLEQLTLNVLNVSCNEAINYAILQLVFNRQ